MLEPDGAKIFNQYMSTHFLYQLDKSLSNDEYSTSPITLSHLRFPSCSLVLMLMICGIIGDTKVDG